MKPNAYPQTTWTLAELLPEASAEVVAERLAELETLVTELESARPELATGLSPERLLELVGLAETISEKAYLLSAYGSLWFASDTQSQEALTYRNRMDQALTVFQNRSLFLSLWWKGLDESEADRLLPRNGKGRISDYRHYLEDLRRLKDYILDEESEQLINLKDANGIQAILTLYSMLTNRLEFEMEVEGKVEKLTRAELSAHFYSPERSLRKSAYDELLRVYGGEAGPLAQIYVNRIHDWANENVELRGFSSPIEVRNIANDVPNEAVETLLSVCVENAPLFQRYFRWKAGQLGSEKLERFDLYAPLGESDRKIPFAEAAALVLETFERFEPTTARLARRVFDDGHLDSEIRKGKKGGAFCATVLPSQTPWVLLNYTGKVRDVATMAHEFGHAVHSMLAEEHSVLTQHPSLPLAETASVFAERLLVDRLLTDEADPVVRRELLASSLDDIYATVMRQAFFVRFEEAAHAAIHDGKSPDDLDRIYLELLRQQFGDAVDVRQEFAREWIAIPHFYQTPFYCYAYSFGQLLVLALYRRYQEEGASFVPGYLSLLAAGGSARPQDVLAQIDVDITDPVFWQGGFDVVRTLVEQVEEL